MSVTRRPTDVEADITAIKKLFRQYTSAWESEDLDFWISLWTSNSIEMPPRSSALIGKDQILEKWKPLFDRSTMKLPVIPEEIVVSGDLAFSRCTFTFSTTPKAGGETNSASGKSLTILERQVDGTWKITRECFNYDGSSS